MFENLLRAEMPLAMRFFLAFIIVAGLLGLTAWTVRRFGSGRFGEASTRRRQPRLAVLEHASIAGGRQIILVRRDNVEHLLMIGGPFDIVVEANIARAAPAADEVMLPRAIPFPKTGLWPPQPVALWSRPEPRAEPPAVVGRPAAADSAAAADQSRAEMMQRFGAAVHEFRLEGEGRAQSAPPAPEYATAVEAAPYSPGLPRLLRSAEVRRALAEEKIKPNNRLYESLKQQMASLLDSSAANT
jgi:hypothetical protein